jgi:hypothetical protein
VERTPELVRGAVFAALVWFLNFEVISRVLYPWFVRGPWQLFLHVVFFGIPLAFLTTFARRRVKYPQEEPEFAHHGAPPRYRES